MDYYRTPKDYRSTIEEYWRTINPFTTGNPFRGQNYLDIVCGEGFGGSKGGKSYLDIV